MLVIFPNSEVFLNKNFWHSFPRGETVNVVVGSKWLLISMKFTGDENPRWILSFRDEVSFSSSSAVIMYSKPK